MNFSQLSEIADRYWCDKGWRGPSSHWSAQNYVDVYQAYLHDRRDEPINLLEIGIGVTGPHCQPQVVHGSNTGGASMKMWSEYLPNASITGIDINPAGYLDTDRVKTYVVDQGSRVSLADFLKQHPDPSFDIIIDDGSHRADDQQVSLEMLFPHLKPGGLYFIEDLNDFGHGGRTGGRYDTPDTLSTRDFFKRHASDGQIADPNAFESTAFLQSIGDIMFHCPRPAQRPRDVIVEVARTLAGRAHRGILRLEWVQDSEQMLVLKKSVTASRAPNLPSSANEAGAGAPGSSIIPSNSATAKIAGAIVQALEAASIRGAPTIMGVLGKIPALARIRATVRLPYGELVTFPAFDPYWSRYLWAGVPFERDVEQIFRKLGAGRVLLDCGANIGYWSVRAREFGFTEVIAVEANSQLIPLLRENFRLNAIQGTVHHAAVYSQSGVDLLLDNSRAHEQAGIGNRGIPVVSITIADMLKQISPDRGVIAKLDVEGSEIAAIEGAKGHEKTIIVYEDFRQLGMPVTSYVLGRNMRVFGVTPRGDCFSISSVEEALAFNRKVAMPRWPSNFVACWPEEAEAVERQLR